MRILPWGKKNKIQIPPPRLQPGAANLPQPNDPDMHALPIGLKQPPDVTGGHIIHPLGIAGTPLQPIGVAGTPLNQNMHPLPPIHPGDITGSATTQPKPIPVHDVDDHALPIGPKGPPVSAGGNLIHQSVAGSANPPTDFTSGGPRPRDPLNHMDDPKPDKPKLGLGDHAASWPSTHTPHQIHSSNLDGPHPRDPLNTAETDDPDMHPLPIGPKPPHKPPMPPPVPGLGPSPHPGDNHGIIMGGHGVHQLETMNAHKNPDKEPGPGYKDDKPQAIEDAHDLGHGPDGILSSGGMTDPLDKEHNPMHPDIQDENPFAGMGGDPREGAGKV